MSGRSVIFKQVLERNPYDPGRHRFAMLTAVASLALIGVGGVVTSRGVGMAVPDWPNTYGYNMFFFPVSQWVGGVFYEHTHRLFASLVGLLTVLLALWLNGDRARRWLRWFWPVVLGAFAVLLWFFSANGWQNASLCLAAALASLALSFAWPRCGPATRGVRLLGWLAVGAVILQGVLGGLRVTLLKDQIGIAHAALAQVFFLLISLIALSTSRWWTEGGGARSTSRACSRVTWFFGLTGLLIFGQTLLGAAMRHAHAGLAVPDFPLAYGRFWPRTDEAFVDKINRERIDQRGFNPITAFQIDLHMAHRMGAGLVILGALFVIWSSFRMAPSYACLNNLAVVWLGLLLVQGLLGAATVWSNKAADIATLHVLVGALVFALDGVLCAMAFRLGTAAEDRLARVSGEGADRPVGDPDRVVEPRIA